MSDPWEITYGPDNYLWVTESKAYQVSRIDPATGKKLVVLDLTDQRLFPRYDKLQKQTGGKPWPQGGLMGMALHPQFLTGSPYVYLAYHYRFAGAADSSDGCKNNFGGCFFTTRIVRYEYNKKMDKLVNPITICDTIPGSNDHNGGRLTIAPVGGKLYLFYGLGDMGAGQFNNAGRPNHAQQPEVYEGKILRFNTIPDSDPGLYDRWIPADNPFNGQKQNAVYSYGHRNPQGLAVAMIEGKSYLYESEHGPYSDDEVNIIDKGKNYGHPLVSGYADGNYNGLALSVTKHAQLPGPWHTTYPQIEREQKNAATIGSAYRNPIISLYPTPNDSLLSLFKNIRADTGQPTGMDFRSA